MESLKQPFSNLVVKETATLNWTIDNFAQVVEAKSSYFPALNSDHEFCLELSAKCRSFSLDHVLLELFHYDNRELDVLLYYRISILDANGDKHHTKEYFWKCLTSDQNDYFSYNVTSYISRRQCNELLVDGSLKLYCEVDTLVEKSDQLPPQKNNEPNGNLVQDLESLLEGGKLSDFIVQIGGKKFQVHKNILAARSPVFAAMFEHGETKEVQEGRVVIEDVPVDVFELLIRYIYTGKSDQLGEHVADLFVAADKYQLDRLKSTCEQSLISSIATESVSAVLLISDMHNAQQLKSKCIEYIVHNWKEVKETKGWKEEIKVKRGDLIEEILETRI